MRNIYVNRYGTVKDQLGNCLHIHRVMVVQANKYSKEFMGKLVELGGKDRVEIDERDEG